MLITVSSENSLVHWNQNYNRTSLICEEGENMAWLLKPVYNKFFTDLAADLADTKHQYSSFVTCWIKHCNNIIKDVKDVVEDYIKRHNITYDDSSTMMSKREIIERICNKVRGNLPEILVEKLATEGIFRSFCKIGTYKPVDDPHKERYSDGNCLHPNTKLIVDIQIKNFNEGNKVGREVFVKCSDTFDEHIRGNEAVIPREKIFDFIDTPHQVIFSFTPAEEMILDQYNKRVIFFGPREIDNLKLQGDEKGNQAMYNLFEEIAEEIADIPEN